MKRMVVVATMRRGVVDPPEPLDGAQQEAAFQRMRCEEAPQLKRGPLYGDNENCVRWNGAKSVRGSYEPGRGVERMMQLAMHRKVG